MTIRIVQFICSFRRLPAASRAIVSIISQQLLSCWTSKTFTDYLSVALATRNRRLLDYRWNEEKKVTGERENNKKNIRRETWPERKAKQTNKLFRNVFC